MKRILFVCFILFLTTHLSGQVEHIDSLENILNTKRITAAEQLDLYEKISRAYLNNDMDKSMEYAQKGLMLAEKEDNKFLAATFNKYLGIVSHNKTNYESSRVYFEKSLEWATKAKDKRAQLAAYGSLGNLYKIQQDYPLAVEYYMKALSVCDEMEDGETAKAATLVNLGVVHRAIHNFERSIDFFEQALYIAEEQGFEEIKMTSSHGLGTVYADKQEYVKSGDYILRALELSRKLNNKEYEIISLMSLATNCSINGDYARASTYAEEGLKVAEEYGNPYRILGTQISLSGIYRNEGRYKESEEIALKAWEVDSTSLGEGAFIALNIALANIHLGNKEKAEEFVWKYQEIVANGNNKSLHNSLANMEIKYEAEKKETRIATLEKEKQLYFWLTVAGAFAFLMALVVLFYRHRLNVQKRIMIEQEREIAQQQVKQLEREKQLVATQAILDGETSERSRIARDLHDGLGGMLSVVKLNLEKEQGNAMKMLDESIVELRRIAHHMMPESLVHYGLRVSLEDFCRAIPNAHFQFIGEDSRLDSRLEVMLYRCAYELINNAVKYAGASHINVQLLIEEKVIALTVDDDGIGFNPEEVTSGTGLENIRTRVLAYNGKITIRSAPEKGTEIILEIESI